MSLKEVNKEYVMSQFIQRVSDLTNESIIKDAYIKQLEVELAALKDGGKMEETAPSDEI